MKKALFVVFVMVCFLTVLAAEVKIAVVNPAAILQSINKGKEAFKRINDLIQQKQQKGQALQAEVERLTREVSNPALSPDAQQRKAIELESRKTELQRYGEDAQREIYAQQQRELEPIQKDLMAIIEDLAKSEKFTLILDLGTTQNSMSNIVFFDQAIDISDRVAQIYNQKFPTQAPVAKPDQPKKPDPAKKSS